MSEATTNAIEAHAELGSSERIVVRCNLGEDRVEVEVRDNAEGFSPADLTPHPPAADPERLEYERGLGIPLMRILADEHEITTGAEGTSVRLVVYTTPPQGETRPTVE